MACSSAEQKAEAEEEADRQAACESVGTYLEETAWPTVLGTNCADCHTPGGPAPANGSDFVLLPPGYPNFQQENLERLKATAAYEVDDVSVLLLKPLGELDHGGGARVKEGSEEYKSLRKLISLLGDADECGENAEIRDHDDVDLLGATGTFRKAALHLAYRLPDSDEVSELSDKGEEALPKLIDDLFEEEAFYERLKDIFNDQFLAERYLAYTGYAVTRLNETMYPAAGEPWDLLEDDDLRRAINHSVADEPLDFVAYLVKNNKPFTDVVAGDYMVVNPLTAPYFNADVKFTDNSDPMEFVETPRRAYVETSDDVYELEKIPSAGVLTSPIFLNRFPTTDTNRNRHRARMILQFFLGTDILKVGDRPLDPTQAGLYPNPTLNDPSCASCHEILDPISSAFQKYSDNDQERYEPTRSWYGEMRAAGYEDEQMPTDDIPRAPAWLGERIARDPRFPFAMVKIVYEGLMGRAPVDYPEDFDAEDYSPRFAAWRDQEALFQAIGQRFVESDYNLRTVFRELLMSPLYRAKGIAGEPDEWRELQVAELGTARLSTPMLLARKIEAVTGIPWRRSWDRSDNLMSDYRILYGGIDSDTVNKRLSTPNGIIASVAWRMANEMSCTLTSWEFYNSADDRALLSEVEVSDVPRDEAGDDIEKAQEKIREQIRILHERVLGEEASDKELDRSFELFMETWKEGQSLIADENNNIGTGLPWQCRARTDQITGDEIPDDDQLRDDPDYVIRSWMAVLTYLLSDYDFLYE